MRDPNKAVSARGVVVDFELLRIKEEISTAPKTVQRETKATRRRRRLSERGAVLAKELAPKPEERRAPVEPILSEEQVQQLAEDIGKRHQLPPEPEVTPTTTVTPTQQKIVRRKSRKE